MLIPKHYEQNDLSEILLLIDHFPLASIVTSRLGILDATHIPLIVESRKPESVSLIGHIDRNNRLGIDAQANENVLVVFRGSDGYITPNWYPGKAKDENQVPTWNFQVLNLTCSLEILDEEKFVRGMIAKLVMKQESDQSKPWKMTDSTKEYIDSNLKKVVGVRLRVKDIKAMYKLSQNRNVDDFNGAVHGLQRIGKDHLAEAMKRTRNIEKEE